MSTHSSSFASRLLPVWCATIACWALILSVPQVMRFEYELQRMTAQLWYPQHQRIHGAGTQEHALTVSKVGTTTQLHAPFVVEMGKDPDKIFASDPLSPSDTAVLLDALKKSGVASVMIGAPLAWSTPDPFALDALELVMAGFSSCVTSARVGRGAEPEPMPAAFVRASLPMTRVIGSSASLPVVNRVTVTGTFLGKENTWAGFSAMESESPAAHRPWLIARWGDRIVFSSALLAVLVREEIRPEELVIEPGQMIQSPRTGHGWQIDPYGRGVLSESSGSGPDLQAPQLIRPDPSDLALLQKHRPPVHLLRAETDGSSISEQTQHLRALHSSPRLLDRVTWYRLPVKTEWIIVGLFAVQAVVVAGLPRPARWYALGGLLLFWLLSPRWSDTWVPLSPGILAFIWTFRMRLAPAIPSAESEHRSTSLVTEKEPHAEVPLKTTKKTIRSKKKR